MIVIMIITSMYIFLTHSIRDPVNYGSFQIYKTVSYNYIV